MLRKRIERGLALLLVIFPVSLVMIFTMSIAANILTEGRREKEKEMIWRGKQYTRAVKLYYRRLGHLPTSINDLTKPKIGTVRFMRQAYKDPMNKEDGSWRLIYVGPAGQLMGSLKPPQQNLQLPQLGGAAGTPASALGTLPQQGATGQSGSLFGQSSFGRQSPSALQPSGAGKPPATPGTSAGTDQSGAGQQAIPSGDTPTIVGGSIIGVGGKIDKSSIIIYDKAKNYRLFEFIWDPSKDNFGVGQPGLQTGTGLGQPVGQQPGQNPINPQQNQPQNPFGPQQNPPQNPQPPPQNPQYPPPSPQPPHQFLFS